MINQRLIETYLARARDLENLARRLERGSPQGNPSSPLGESASLRREAMWWQAFAKALAKAA